MNARNRHEGYIFVLSFKFKSALLRTLLKLLCVPLMPKGRVPSGDCETVASRKKEFKYEPRREVEKQEGLVGLFVLRARLLKLGTVKQERA